MRNIGKTAVIVIGTLFLFLLIRSEKTLFWSDQSPFSVTHRGKTFLLEVVRSEADRERGLSGRESLCDTCGMLFVFPEAGQYGFWMKGMQFPIDIVWLSEEKIVAIERSVSPENEQRIFRPIEKADRVLELPSEASAEWSVGENIEFSSGKE